MLYVSARVVFAFLIACVLGCSGKKEDVAPVALPSLTGTWDMTKLVVTLYNADGTVRSTTTHDDYVAAGEIWSHVFHADGRFEYQYQGQPGRTGTYTYTATHLVQTNNPGYAPTHTYDIDKLAATEMLLARDLRPASNQKSVSTWVKR